MPPQYTDLHQRSGVQVGSQHPGGYPWSHLGVQRKEYSLCTVFRNHCFKIVYLFLFSCMSITVKANGCLFQWITVQEGVPHGGRVVATWGGNRS